MNKHTPANQLATVERDGPSLFVGLSLEVGEIIIAHNKLTEGTRTLQEAFLARHEAAVKQAADDIAEITKQMAIMSAHIASVISRHQARKPRV